MILNKLKNIFSGDDEKPKKDVPQSNVCPVENTDNKSTEDFNAKTSVDKNLTLQVVEGKKTKQTKENIQLRRTKTKKRSNRTSHIIKSYARKNNVPVSKRINAYDVIKKPILSDKAAKASEKGVYTFLVNNSADKYKIADSIELIYGVVPEKIRISKNAAKPKRLRVKGREREYGQTSPKKKAYVYLKKGDKIELT